MISYYDNFFIKKEYIIKTSGKVSDVISFEVPYGTIFELRLLEILV